MILPVAKHLSGLLPNTFEYNRNTDNDILSLVVVNKAIVSLYKMHVLQLHTAGSVFVRGGNFSSIMVNDMSSIVLIKSLVDDHCVMH